MLNRHKGFQVLWGSAGAVVNLVITSLILSFLVALLAGRGTHRGASTAPPRADWLLTRLPAQRWRMGLLFGAAAAGVVIGAAGVADLLGVSGLTLVQMLVVKCVYCGVLAFLVVRCTSLRAG